MAHYDRRMSRMMIDRDTSQRLVEEVIRAMSATLKLDDQDYLSELKAELG